MASNCRRQGSTYGRHEITRAQASAISTISGRVNHLFDLNQVATMSSLKILRKRRLKVIFLAEKVTSPNNDPLAGPLPLATKHGWEKGYRHGEIILILIELLMSLMSLHRYIIGEFLIMGWIVYNKLNRRMIGRVQRMRNLGFVVKVVVRL